MVTFSVQDGHGAHPGHARRDPLPQPGRPALHLADPGGRRQRPAGRGGHDPGLPDLAGARPHGALQRLQAALPGAHPGGRQPALLRDRPGLPGRGRHARGPAVAHRLGDLDAGRPRPADRRPDRQPRPGPRPRRRPRRPALRADRDLPPVRARAEDRPAGDPRLARPDLLALGRDRRAWSPASASRSSATSTSCAASPATLDKNKAELDRALQVLPIKLDKVGRTAIYGSWFNFYLCEFKGRACRAARSGSRSRDYRPDRTGATSDEPPHDIARCAPDPAGAPG